MINLKKLIQLLPAYYKDADTYKDENSMGILERFLNICGDYFNDQITPDIDNAVNLIDIDTTDPIYLNYIWELFGSIPYAYGVLIDTRLWNTYGNVANNRSEWLRVITAIQPRANARNLLKFAIPLYKIRGTLPFYDMLLNFYGYKCVVTDPSGDLINPTPSLNIASNVPLYDSGLLYDNNEKYDISRNCLSCVNISLKVYTEYGTTLISTDNNVLYNNIAVNKTNFSPSGWHVPTIIELQALLDFCGGNAIAGKKLKEVGTDNWLTVGGTDEYGFKLKGTGLGYQNTAIQLKSTARLWSSTVYHVNGSNTCIYFASDSDSIQVMQEADPLKKSVRLIKDSPTIGGDVTDLDGNVYHEVKIGNQVWMVENWACTKYNDGTPISRSTDPNTTDGALYIVSTTVNTTTTTTPPTELDRDFLDRLCSLLNRFRPLNVIEFTKDNVAIYNRPISNVEYGYDDLTGYELVII